MQNQPNPMFVSTVRKQEIEQAAEQLRKVVAENQYRLWPGEQRTDIQLLDPDGVCRAIRFNYREQQGLTRQPFSLRNEKVPTAGQVDLRSETITVDADLPETIKRFTALHEVGHVVIHPDQITMHRDSPLGGNFATPKNRPLMEQEADYFAACYSMPRDLVVREFSKRFGIPPFQMTDQWAQVLSPADPDALIMSRHGALDRELAMATAQVRERTALAGYFKVSAKAMAIRLQELNLIKWP